MIKIACEYCEELDNLDEWEGYTLCEDCIEVYDNKTGYCSLDCCISGNCDQSC